MLGKILFTLSIIMAVFAFVRIRQQRGDVAHTAQTAPKVQRNWGVGWLASGAVVLMLLASGFLLYDHWRASNQLVQIQVIDGATGKQTDYTAYRGDIDEREFITIQGAKVVLSERDRLILQGQN
jgi:hypothetical protein